MSGTQPSIAGVAALVGNPARANILSVRLDGRALTATELAHIGGVPFAISRSVQRCASR
jgi:hypothetical protein